MIGQFNEMSDDGHMLIDRMAESRVAKVARMEGMQQSDHEKAIVVGQLRRQLSTACIRAGSQCLLDRMHQCGEGAHMAAKRRDTSHQVEMAMRHDREIQWLARVRNPVVNRGQFLRN